MMKLSAMAALAISVLLLASCGDDDADEKSKDRTATTDEALFTARELIPAVEREIVRRAKREDRAAGNDPDAYTYEVKCLSKSETELGCRLDVVDEAGKKVNTVGYTADVDPDTGEYGYTVVSNRDTRKPPDK